MRENSQYLVVPSSEAPYSHHTSIQEKKRFVASLSRGTSFLLDKEGKAVRENLRQAYTHATLS